VLRNRGFSLIELFVALSVAAILLAVATPSLASFFRTNRLAAASNELVVSLQVARAEAARRGRDVSVCRSTDGATCANSTAWAAGWIVFQDANSSGAAAPTGAGSELIRVFDPLDTSLALAGPDTHVRFRPNGSIDTTGSAEQTFTVTVEGCSGMQKRRISLSRLGRVRTSSLACSAT
jgi:type IV fimbrial biogenesis protein FimT